MDLRLVHEYLLIDDTRQMMLKSGNRPTIYNIASETSNMSLSTSESFDHLTYHVQLYSLLCTTDTNNATPIELSVCLDEMFSAIYLATSNINIS